MSIQLNKLIKGILLIVICFLVISCDREDVSLEKPIRTISFLTNYMDYSYLPDLRSSHEVLSSTITTSHGLVEIEFEGQNIVRKKGGYGELPSLGAYFFSSEIVDEVFYNINKIGIENKSYSSDIEYIRPNLRAIELNNSGLMIRKVNNRLYPMTNGDTIYDIITKDYTYNAEKLLVKTHITQKLLNYYEHSNFPDNIRSYADASYYYTNNNLDSIVTIEHDYVEEENKYLPKRKIVETFSNYDDSENPLKSLYIFEETFKRSLSKNNFGSYRRDVYTFIDEIGEHSFSYQVSHILKYDVHGNIRFDI